MKKLCCILLCAFLAFSSFYALAEEEIKVIVSGESVEFDVKPEIINGRTFVPVRAIFEAMGAKVEWSEATETVTAEKIGQTVELKVGEREAHYGSEKVLMDTAPLIKNGRVLVPARYAAEGFGYLVEWNGGEKTVVISHDASKIACYRQGGVPDFGALYGIEAVDTSEGYYLYDLKDITEKDPEASSIKDYTDILYDMNFIYASSEKVNQDGVTGTLYFFGKDETLAAVGLMAFEGEYSLYISIGKV